MTYSNLGDSIAIGLGGSNSKCGTFVILSEEELTFLYEAKDSNKSISIMKYSPDGETLAVGADDGVIYLYAVNDEYELIGRCLRHSSSVRHIDFSHDGEWLRSNSISRELYFFSADDASYQSNVSAMRDLEWASSTCIYGWHVKSIHLTCWENERITTLHTPSPDANILICATDQGYLKIHSHPCPTVDLDYFHRYQAHIGNVVTVRFSYDSAYLLTAGSQDRSIMLWRFISEHDYEDKTEVEIFDNTELALEAAEPLEIDELTMPHAPLDQFIEDNDRGLPSNCNVWLESTVGPSGMTKAQRKDIPAISLVLEYVYGFSSQDMRNNVCYTDVGEIVYVCSTLGIVMNRSNRSEKFYQQHDDKITAFCCNGDGSLVATGNMGLNPVITVWNPNTCERLATMPDKHFKAVSTIVFSPSSEILAASTLDIENTVTIYDWKNQLVLSRTLGGHRKLLNMCFSYDESVLCGCGVKSIVFWRNIKSRHPTSLKANLGGLGKLQTFLSCVYFGNSFVVSTMDGHLYLFSDNTLTQTVKAHDGSIYSIVVSTDKICLCTAGKDGVIRFWSTNLECINEIELNRVINASSSISVRSLSFSIDGNNLLIGTSAADIFEISIKNSRLAGSYLMSSHGKRGLYGLASHPTKDEFITAGDDGTIRIFDPKTFKMIKSIKIDSACRCATYSPNGKMIAVGFGSGRHSVDKSSVQTNRDGVFVILTSIDHKVIHEGRDSNEPIRVIKFSPDGSNLVCGSEDSRIYIYNVKDHFSRRSVVTSHK